MNRLGLALWIGAFCAAGGLAQSPSSAQESARASGQASADASKQASGSASAASSGNAQAGESGATLAGGSTLNAMLESSLDSKKCKPGDPVKARSTEDVKSNGKTVLPKGTKLVGHVTQASAKSKGDSESAIGIVFDKAMLKHGEEMPVSLSIQAIGAAPANAYATGSDLTPMGGMGGAPAAPGGGGMAGGAAAGGNGAAGTASNTAARVGNVAGGTVNSTTNAAGNVAATSREAVGGLNAGGEFTSNSRGVFGLNGLNLSSTSANSAGGSVITSDGKHVQLESGTRMLLVSQARAGGNGK